MKTNFTHKIIFQGSLNQQLGVAGQYRPRLPHQEVLHLSPEQTRLYKGAINGADKRTSVILNRMKWQVINELSGHLFGSLFPDAPLAKGLSTKYPIVDEECHLSFADLKIPKRVIIDKLIQNNILPKQFYELA